MNYPPEERLYVKILLTKDECSVISRKVFEEAAIIATTIAQFKNSTFSNFYMNRSESAERLRGAVFEYLQLRYTLLPVSLGEFDESHMTRTEKTKYLEIVLQNIGKSATLSSDGMDDNPNHLSLPNITIT